MPRRPVVLALVLTAVLLWGSTIAWGGSPALEWPPEPPEIGVERLVSGVRLIHLPRFGPAAEDSGDASVDIAFGYAVDSPDSDRDRVSQEIIRAWLLASVPARTIQLTAHLAGGGFEPLEQADLVGIRVRVPPEAAGFVVEQAARLLGLRLGPGPLLDYVLESRRRNAERNADGGGDPAQRVLALLGGSDPAPDAGRDVEPADSGRVIRYFRDVFGTDRAWVAVSFPIGDPEMEPLHGLDARPGEAAPRPGPELREVDSREVLLPSRGDGAVLIGSVISPVYYEGWFNALIVDRALQRILPPGLTFRFGPSRNMALHLIEAPVRFPAYPGEVAASIMSGIGELEARDPVGLPEIKEDALAYLASRPVLEWFAARDLWAPLGEGWARVWSLTRGEFRASVTAFRREQRITLLRPPALDAPPLAIGGLDPLPVAPPAPLLVAPGDVEIPPLTDLPVRGPLPVRVERLASGAGLAAGDPAIFVAGASDLVLPGGLGERGPNGTLWTFDAPPGAAVFDALDGVRADRLLVFAPSGAEARYRPLLASWSGGRTDATDARDVGEVATADLPGLVVLGAWLETRVIASGWSDTVRIRISGTGGSRLSIDADPPRREAVEEWLSSAEESFEGEAGEARLESLRRAAGTDFDSIRPDLAMLLFQRAPGGEIAPPDTVSLTRLRSVLDTYF